MEKKIKDLENEAREKAKLKDKRSALMALKKKKMYESQLDDLGKKSLSESFFLVSRCYFDEHIFGRFLFT